MVDNKSNSAEIAACDPSLSRKEFLDKVVSRAAIAGSLIAAPMLMESFSVPAYATLISGTKKQLDVSNPTTSSVSSTSSSTCGCPTSSSSSNTGGIGPVGHQAGSGGITVQDDNGGWR